MTEHGRLSREDVEAAITALRNPRYTSCSHVVHPLASGWTSCANCFAPVYVEGPS